MHAPRPRATVAVPTYNGARHLRETLESILAQDDADFDLVVVDDRSEDETHRIVEGICGPRARLIVNPKRLGLARNWNRCAELAETPIVAIVHQDDLLDPGHLRLHREAHAGDDRLGMVVSSARMIDEAGQDVTDRHASSSGRERTFEPGAFLSVLATGNPVRCSAVSMKVDAWRGAGGFDPSWRYAVDWEFWGRLAMIAPVRWLGEATASARWHEASETHRFKSGLDDLREVGAIMERIQRAAKTPPRDAQQARAALARAYLNRAFEAAKGGRKGLMSEAIGAAARLSAATTAGVLADPRVGWRILRAWIRPSRAASATTTRA